MRKDLLLALSVLGLTLACRDEDRSPTAPDTSPAPATTASTLVFTQVSVGVGHSCAVTSESRLFCWGRNGDGQLGDGTTTDRLVPVPVGGALRFRQVSAGFFGTCAVTTTFRAYCWGDNTYGQLGDGTTTPRLRPAAVAGGRQFRRVETFLQHSCAVTYPGNKAFCWGNNAVGQLGIGNNTGPQEGKFGAFSPKPVAVLSSLTFRHVTVGNQHSCGATNDDRVFCWGYNQYGQVGDGSGGWLKLKPVRVAGTRQYRQVDAGQYHTCAVTTANRAFCWGKGSFGQLGNGARHSTRSPQAVSGGLSFDRVAAGDDLTCAETTGNRVYCWGLNILGSVGDGTFTDRLAPVPVVGGLSFTQVSAGDDSCGISGGHVYCWGSGDQGYLGTGSTEDSPTPVRVSDPAGTS